ncbi:MAG: AraC family transcriptional regulator [Paludibacteraceae bacterium]|nr:AraC family transcriptional regulator [Paludibacteraceae bacterium]MBQ2189966.1 AraC family transcriptional regulator [Paludibacteraceae bacterium]MBQ2520071.1 AraC family transcriptional regulator [Paludibacteraceae bacterium]MBQ4017990.1 AraC family transcriptional regulator [Paludibacteraceae bacterium]
MTLSTDSIFLTTDKEGFRVCRETRTTSVATMTVLYCCNGYIDVFYHGEMIRINKGYLFIRVPDFTHELGPYEMSPDFEFKQVTVDADIYEKLMYDHMRVEPNWWAKQEYVKENPLFELNEPSREFFDIYFDLLTMQLRDKMTAYRKQILMLIARAATMEMLNYMDKLALVDDKVVTRNSVNQSDYTFREFTRLLQQYPHQREVQWYAQKLGITPKYLSEICKERSDKSAGEWIADITVAEIKHYLRNTTHPIREIARIMEFPNASFFCQYTKKHTGLTPNHYRKEKQA